MPCLCWDPFSDNCSWLNGSFTTPNFLNSHLIINTSVIIDQKNINNTYIFIDESGDPIFYGKRKKLLVGTDGFQPYLIMGMIETENRKTLRKKIIGFIESIKKDSLYNSIPSVAAEKRWLVHARGDHPEIRAKFFELIRSLKGYKAHIVIAKKDLNNFDRKHNGKPAEFYFDVLHHLLNGRLYNSECQYMLYLSQKRQ